ncbi:hypothetical protein TNCV_3632701 [Trichonephila clavipes]|nr:hypothetical protein TNCV_3632701 [Trichonephila clavipes]
MRRLAETTHPYRFTNSGHLKPVPKFHSGVAAMIEEDAKVFLDIAKAVNRANGKRVEQEKCNTYSWKNGFPSVAQDLNPRHDNIMSARILGHHDHSATTVTSQKDKRNNESNNQNKTCGDNK